MKHTALITAGAALLFSGVAILGLVTSAGTAVAQSPQAATTAAESSSQENAVTPATDALTAPEASPSGSANSAGLTAPSLLLQQLRVRERDLERREQALANEREALEAAESEVEARIAELQQVRDQLATNLQQIDRERQQRISSLATWCAGMEPKAAADQLSTQETDVISEVLMAMNERAAAAVLEQFEPARAGDVMREMSNRR